MSVRVKDLLLRVKALWHSRTVRSYNAYLSHDQSCYDAKSNSCNGTCQGCSDCIIAREFRGEVRFVPAIRVRYDMLLSKERSKIADKIFQEMRDRGVLDDIIKRVKSG